MLNPVIILHRADLPRAFRDVTIEDIGLMHLPLMEPRISRDCPQMTYRANERTAELILFVDERQGRVKVLKTRNLQGLFCGGQVCVPPGTILPTDYLDRLFCGKMDLNSPRVVMPRKSETPWPAENTR